MLDLGRKIFWVLLAVLAVTLFATVASLPPAVASHFDGRGVPNAWSSRATYTMIMVAVGGLLPMATIGLVHLLTRRGPALLNIPWRAFWLDPQHQAEAVRRARAYIWWLGCVLVMAGIAVHFLVVRANADHPVHLSTPGIFGVIAGILLGIGLWTAGWYRLLRPPSKLK